MVEHTHNNPRIAMVAEEFMYGYLKVRAVGRETSTSLMANALLCSMRGLKCVIGAVGRLPALMSTEGYAQIRKLVMTHKGQAFELPFKHRQLHSGPEVYRACDALQQTISRFYRQAGIKQRSSPSGRRLLAAKVRAATGDVETVQMILEHSDLDHSKPYVSVDQATIQRAFELAL